MLEGELTVSNCEILFEMHVCWCETVFHLAGAWVPQPRQTQRTKRSVIVTVSGMFRSCCPDFVRSSTGPYCCGKVKCNAWMWMISLVLKRASNIAIGNFCASSAAPTMASKKWIRQRQSCGFCPTGPPQIRSTLVELRTTRHGVGDACLAHLTPAANSET